MENSLRILLIGNGGREHTLAWKLNQSRLVEKIYVVPGNGGTAQLSKVTNISNIAANDYPGLVAFAQQHKVKLVVPGPEAPLVDGIEGFFRDAAIPCFGPSKEAARMEGSKTFSKDFMKRHNIPTAAYENFTDYEKAKEYLEKVNHDVVIKASGLAAGKGVIIPQSRQEGLDALKEIMLNKEFGSAGDEVVIEEFLEGDELSILSFCDGYTIRSLPPAQDHKRINDGDMGPNTGGMGCYAPTTIATPALIKQMEDTILKPTIVGMRHERMPFVGCLFTGFMITKDGPKTLEYNVRFGDPETQTLIPLLSEDTDLAEVMLACAKTYLDAVTIKVEKKFSATVVAAAGGYPGSYSKGTPMDVGIPSPMSNIFHAGTALTNDKLVTSGGRVIAAQAIESSLQKAVNKAYETMGLIKFDGMHFRKDIAHRALKPKSSIKDALTYASAGVSIDAGNNFVERIKAAVKSTARPGADAVIGGFGGELDLSKAGYGGPIIVAAIDGVGTKLMIAEAMNKHNTVGIDLVAMNVNDLIVQGAEPLMFTDYFGCSKLNLEIAANFIEGVSEGCRQAGAALVGGETAEMPGMYKGEEYDAAGQATGAMFPKHRLPRTDLMQENDVLIGLASDGVHSNGFSLVRKIVEREGLLYTDPCPWDSAKSLGESLLTPTRIYVKSLLPILRHERQLVKGLAHITGGGLTENIPRMLPSDNSLSAEIDIKNWELPAVFKWLKKSGNVDGAEMAKTFNTGIGMVMAVGAGDVETVQRMLREAGEKSVVIGRLVNRDEGMKGCVLEGLKAWDEF